jgi:hypothetical protein
MPRIDKLTEHDAEPPALSAEELAESEAEEARRPVRVPPGWRRSDRGNLYRTCKGKLRAVVICPRASKEGRFSWALFGMRNDFHEYSEQTYESESEALEALAAVLHERKLL